MANPWFRLYSEFASDPVVQSLAFEDQRHFVVILCLKCTGLLDRKADAKKRELLVCRGLGLDLSTAAEVKRRLVEVGIVDKFWQPINWNKRQYVSDHSGERVRKYRNNNDSRNGFVTPSGRYGNVPEQNRPEQKRKEHASHKVFPDLAEKYGLTETE